MRCRRNRCNLKPSSLPLRRFAKPLSPPAFICRARPPSAPHRFLARQIDQFILTACRNRSHKPRSGYRQVTTRQFDGRAAKSNAVARFQIIAPTSLRSKPFESQLSASFFQCGVQALGKVFEIHERRRPGVRGKGDAVCVSIMALLLAVDPPPGGDEFGKRHPDMFGLPQLLDISASSSAWLRTNEYFRSSAGPWPQRLAPSANSFVSARKLQLAETAFVGLAARNQAGVARVDSDQDATSSSVLIFPPSSRDFPDQQVGVKCEATRDSSCV